VHWNTIVLTFIKGVFEVAREPERPDANNDTMENHCGWVDPQGCDAELLVELTIEMSDLIFKDMIKMDDSRCFFRLCIDMALHFQELHKNADWDSKDFVGEIVAYCGMVKNKLRAYPDWINLEYKWMYGKETVSDLLVKP